MIRFAGMTLAVIALTAAPSARAQTPSAPSEIAPPQASPVAAPSKPPAASDKLALGDDGVSRMTIPVMINGQGPFPFIIDTGADRTVISSELAAALKLPSGPHVTLHESAGVEDIQTAVIERLVMGKRVVEGIDAPVVSAANLGAMGLLGIDSLRDQHVVLDFKAQKLLSSESRPEAFDPDTIVVRGKSRFGQLVLVDATIRDIPVYVILDSGAQNTIGNLALQRLLTYGALNQHPTAQVISITGGRTPAAFRNVTEMHIGGLTIRDMPLAFAPLHTFTQFGLTDRPAMLLGMDVLGLCQKVTVDFKRREATFTVN